jgi:transcriptional regulator with GAF, ATPase, and Fis domain
VVPYPAVFGGEVRNYGGQVSVDPAVDLAHTFADIALALSDGADPTTVLDRIVHLSTETIDSCEHAGITAVEGRTVSSPASSDELPAIVDRLQAETGEGPCIDTIREHKTSYTGRLSAEDRWPAFAGRASAESGVESVLSLRLFVGADTLGALNLYSSVPDTFGPHDAAMAALFATHAALAWSVSQTIADLRAGIDTRQLIGEATGILMARQHVTRAEAFDVLRRASQRLNVKLWVIAERVVRPEDEPEDEGEEHSRHW